MILLVRNQYTDTETMGIIRLADLRLYSIEQPWVPVMEHKGGKPFHSCVPDGTYDLLPFNSEKHPNTWCLVNEDLNVYYKKDDLPKSGGRYKCLIHTANWSYQVQGCVAPGMNRVIMQTISGDFFNAVSLSRKALNLIRQHFDQPRIEIISYGGTKEVAPWR